MTIAALYAPDVYTGNGVLDTYPVTFNFLNTSTNVKVSIKTIATGVIVAQVAGTHYNVSTTNVVFTVGNIPTNAQQIIIEYNPSYLQLSDYTENSAFSAETLERDLDARCMEIQLNRDQSVRSIKFDPAADMSGTTLETLPDPSGQGSSALTLNSGATGWEYVALENDLVYDTTPQLGGSLDTNGKVITGGSKITFTTPIIELGNGAGSPVELRILEQSTYGTNYVSFRSPANLANSMVYTLPHIVGSPGQYLNALDNLGTLTWATPSLDLLTDTSPQLGGNLDTNGRAITDATEITLSATTIKNYGALNLRGIASNVDSKLVFWERAASGTNYIQFICPSALAVDSTYTLPVARPSVTGQVLSSTTTGTMSWIDAAAGTSGIASVVEDLSPQLGGILDLNSYGIVAPLATEMSLSGTAIGLHSRDTAASGKLSLYEALLNGTNTVSVQAPASVTTSVAYTLPEAPSASGKVLASTDAGIMSWVDLPAVVTPGILDLVEDLTPQLGGNLDVNGHKITSAAALELTGAYGDMNFPYLNVGFHTGTGSSYPGEIRFSEHETSGVNYIALQAPSAITSSITYVLPEAPSVSGKVLASTTAGIMSWTDLPSAGLTDIVNDTTPQLGGNLDTNGKTITSTSGDIVLSSASTVKLSKSDAGSAQLNLESYGTTKFIGIRPPINLGASYAMELPPNMGTSGQVLRNNSGVLGWLTLPAAGISDVVADTTPQLGGDLDLNGKKITSATTATFQSTGSDVLIQSTHATGYINLTSQAGIKCKGGAAGVKPYIFMYEAGATPTDFIGITVPDSITTSVNYTLPIAPETSGSVMVCDTSGTMSWTNTFKYSGNGAPAITGANRILLVSQSVEISNGSGVGALKFMEGSGSGTDYVGLKGPASVGSATSVVYELPGTPPSVASMLLSTATNGVMTWVNGITTGTFTPTVASGITTPTYTTQQGSWTRVGNMMTVMVNLVLSGGTLNGDQLAIGTLPVAAATTLSKYAAHVGFQVNITTTSPDEDLHAHVAASGTTILCTDSLGASFIGTRATSSSVSLCITTTYQV